jgi:hypothetical protein
MENDVISFNISNSTNGDIPVSILGNPANPMDNANATTRYNWDVTTLTFGTLDSISILFKGVFEVSFSTAQLSFSLQSYQGVCDALNTLNLGVFFVTTSGGSTFIDNYNENFVFGQLNIYDSATPQQINYSFDTTPETGGSNNIFKNAVSQVSVLNPVTTNGVINASNGDTILFNGTTPATSSFDVIVSSPSLPYPLYIIYGASTNLPFSYSFTTSNLYDYGISVLLAAVYLFPYQLHYNFNTSDIGGSNNFDVNAINIVSDPNPIVTVNGGFPFSAGDTIDFYGTTPSVAGYNVILTNFSTGVIEYQLNNAAANTPYSYTFVAVLGNVYTASVSL